MSIGVFTERQHQPTEGEIRQAIGPKLPLWQALIQFIRDTYPVEEDFGFLYGKKYGWARRFQIKGRFLANLYPAQGCFKAQVNLSPAAVEAALGLPLGQNAQQAIANAPPFQEGRWLFIPVESKQDLQDVQRLLELRLKSLRSQPRPRGVRLRQG